MKTPGVYIQEKNAFSTTVVEAATAIPAFIGITEKAVNGSESLANKPWKITSMTELLSILVEHRCQYVIFLSQDRQRPMQTCSIAVLR